jgi:predicted nucleic acid-binding protein
MKVVLDACVLYPPLLRAILVGVALQGLYQPMWSARILEEWARAARKRGRNDEADARLDAARLNIAFPRAMLSPAPGIEARLVLPDENDAHVLAVAIAGSADAILTYNARDFPRGLLAGESIARRDPDGFLWELWSHNPEVVAQVLEQVRTVASDRAGQEVVLKSTLKRLRLNRLAKAVAVAAVAG